MRVTGSLIKLLIFAAVTLVLTGLLASVIGNITFRDTASYRARFVDVTSLNSGDDVRIAGVKVGQVSSIKIVDRKFAEVGFTVDKSIPLHKSERAQIRYRNLLGQRYVALDEGPGSDATLPAGSVIPLTQTKPALDLTALFNGFKPLFQALSPKDVNNLAFEIIQTLQGEGGTINSLLANTASLTNTIADRDAVIGRVIDNLNAVLATVDQRDQRFGELIGQFQRLATGLAQDREAIGGSLNNISNLAASTASLLTDIRPPLQPDIVELGALSNNLDRNKGTIDEYVRRLPTKLTQIIRTGQSGSWFNFYLCQADLNLQIPLATGQTVNSPVQLKSTQAVCNS